ncbi:SDR family oxidoreductase [Dysgonomonas sp. ZJ709]|uniref:SDR family NAD(P)-dependent oxidoreductase n=1 Tax=Dysgonomonas sp. ZJ709 TaxID=2709797 RepID=UPI0013EA9BEC|nr:SDR family NAD(P)-dependent oxidoreductase [Dysgonomonas sp. ZJ709]
MNINGKHIILTGASAGIGYEILKILTTYKNVKIIAVARHVDMIKSVEGVVFPFVADASTQEGVDSIFTFARETIGRIDLFIANAGFAYLEKLDAPNWKHIENIYNLNTVSPIYSLQQLIEEKADNKAFVCIISGAGFVSLPGYSLYCSTKAALHHFIETYRYEQNKNLQITAVYPIATHTDFFDKATGEADTPLPWPNQNAKTVARKIVKGIEKGQKRIYPSLLFRIFYPIGRAFPVFLKLYSLMEKRKVRNWL